MAENEEFLGDGLYASFDGWHFGLRAARPDGDHVVYLEMGNGQTLQAFERYVARMKAWLDEEKTKGEKREAQARDSREGF